jgi:hypothetical protein
MPFRVRDVRSANTSTDLPSFLLAQGTFADDNPNVFIGHNSSGSLDSDGKVSEDTLSMRFSSLVKVLLLAGVIGVMLSGAAGIVSLTQPLGPQARAIGATVFLLSALLLAGGFGMARAELSALEAQD